MCGTQLLITHSRRLVGFSGHEEVLVCARVSTDNECKQQIPDDQDQIQGVGTLVVEQAGIDMLSASLSGFSLPPHKDTHKVPIYAASDVEGEDLHYLILLPSAQPVVHVSDGCPSHEEAHT